MFFREKSVLKIGILKIYFNIFILKKFCAESKIILEILKFSGVSII